MTSRRRALVVALALALGACAPRPAQVSPVAQSVAVAPVVRDYHLQIGDELDVRFYKTPELNALVKVRSDGKISLELIDDVSVVGLSPVELDALLTQRYANELREPEITVMVKEFGGERVYVGGEVGQPKVVTLAGEMTALQAIQEAQGFKDTASPKDVLLIRRKPDGARSAERIDLAAAVAGSGPGGDVYLAPFDIVYVPRSTVADLDLFVDQYIRKILPVQPNVSYGIGF